MQVDELRNAGICFWCGRPTISVDTPVFNCDGSATSTVTVTNSGSTKFSYDYFMDGVAQYSTYQMYLKMWVTIL
jgi:hypothetical protein